MNDAGLKAGLLEVRRRITMRYVWLKMVTNYQGGHHRPKQLNPEGLMPDCIASSSVETWAFLQNLVTSPSHLADQASSLWIVDHFGNRSISNALNRFVNDMERY